MREVEERIWIVRVLSQVRLLPRNTNSTRRYKVSWRIRDWLRAPNDVEIQQPVMSHTETDRSAFEEFLDTAAIAFQIIPFSGLPAYLHAYCLAASAPLFGQKWCYVR